MQFSVALVLFNLYLREHSEYLKWWSLSYSLSALRHVLGVLFIYTGAEFTNVGMHLMLIFAGVFLLHGTALLAGAQNLKWWFSLGLLVSGWMLVGSNLDWSFLTVTLPVFLFRGFTDLLAGIVLLRSVKARGLGKWVASASFILWGFHRFNYPFLRPLDWFAPWGFALASVLGVVTGLGLLVLHYDRAKAEGEASEASFRDMFENALDGYIRNDRQGVILAANPALVAMLGYSSEAELLAKNLRDDIWESPQDWAYIRDVDGVVDGLEAKWRKRDGRLIHVVIRVRQVVRDHVEYFEGSVRDLTENRMLEEQLELGRRLEAVGRLAGGVAHDFNNILTAVLSGVDMMEHELAQGRDPTEDLEAIRVAAMRAAELSNQLLAFSRADGGKVVPVQVSATLRTLELMLTRILPRDVELNITIASEDWVMAQGGALERVLLNLAVNAQDAMPGGGRLEISVGPHSDGVICLKVSDTGEGIDAGLLNSIFEPYFTTKGDEGTGLGLFNVYRIIDSMGGEIRVESSKDAGTTFEMLLPTCIPPDDDGKVSQAAVDGENRCVMVVEDKEIVRRSLVATLKSANFQVVAASSAEEAKAILEEGREVDLLISDIMMEGASGVELVEELRDMRPEIPYLLISGFVSDELRGRILDSPNFLSKPFGARTLLERVGLLLGGE